jgi:hypothetical protein
LGQAKMDFLNWICLLNLAKNLKFETKLTNQAQLRKSIISCIENPKVPGVSILNKTQLFPSTK